MTVLAVTLTTLAPSEPASSKITWNSSVSTPSTSAVITLSTSAAITVDMYSIIVPVASRRRCSSCGTQRATTLTRLSSISSCAATRFLYAVARASRSNASQLSASVTTSCFHSTRGCQRPPGTAGGSDGVGLGGGGDGGGLGGGDGGWTVQSS